MGLVVYTKSVRYGNQWLCKVWVSILCDFNSVFGAGLKVVENPKLSDKKEVLSLVKF